jgi:DNA-directed RNA polymerase sigma subunit (sigma70/sigma32)
MLRESRLQFWARNWNAQPEEVLEMVRNNLPEIDISDRDREIVRLRLGLVTGLPVSLQRLANDYGISTSRIRSIEMAVLGLIRRRHLLHR